MAKMKAAEYNTTASYGAVIADAIPACTVTQAMLDKWERAKARMCVKVATAAYIAQLRFHGISGREAVFSSPTSFQAGWITNHQYSYRNLMANTARWLGATDFIVLVDSRLNETHEERKAWRPLLAAPNYLEAAEQPVF